jgi:DNA-binding CsgD family transcriptional regulator
VDTTFNAATPAAPRRQDWTARQREVLDLIADGRTNGEIAEALNISLGGAKWHVSEIMSKLGVESREAAAAYWTGERSARRRMRRAMHALGAPVFVKWMAAGGVTVAIGAGVAVAVLPLLADEPAPEVAAATVPRPAVFSNDQALAVARDLAQQLALGPFATYYMPPGERALGNPAGGFIMPAGSRRLDSNDLELVSAQFIRDTRSVESNVTGKTVALDAPADVWVVRFATRPPEQPDADHDADVLVAFRDGSGLPIVGGEIGADPVTHMPGGGRVGRDLQARRVQRRPRDIRAVWHERGGHPLGDGLADAQRV